MKNLREDFYLYMEGRHGGSRLSHLFLSCFEDILGILGLNFREGLIGDVFFRLLGVSWAKKDQSLSV